MTAFPVPERQHLMDALLADLVGPYDPDLGEELLSRPPQRWYLTGFLAPGSHRVIDEDPTNDDELGMGNDEDEEETAGQEPAPKRPRRFPSSMGLSVFLPPGKGDTLITVVVSYADYHPESPEIFAPGADAFDEAMDSDAAAATSIPKTVYRRLPRGPIPVSVPLDPEALAAGVLVPDSNELYIHGKIETLPETPGLAPGTRGLSIFLVNARGKGLDKPRTEHYVFQVHLALEYPEGFVPRSNRTDETSRDFDARIADLQYRDTFEYAVGHGVSIHVPSGGPPVARVETTWIPVAQVSRVRTHEETGVQTGMLELAQLTTAAQVSQALDGLPAAYRAWIQSQRGIPLDTASRRETRDTLMQRAERAASRIEDGIQTLKSDPVALRAFCLANQAMATAAQKRLGLSQPRWRLFQLAFVLLNLPSIRDPLHEDRDAVELVFFPTGGGKTEAYLGVIAFTLLLRRLRGQERPDRGYGVAVLLRYTLRLLTLDQLERAAILICALESLRRQDSKSLGEKRFAAGLWVGRSATSNTLREVSARITDYKTSNSTKAESPFPLTKCPWCATDLTRDSLRVEGGSTHPQGVTVNCVNFRCDFNANRNPGGLPVLFVDEQIYKELPAFVIGTVDKFAMLPWRGETGKLFGRVTSFDATGFQGPMDKAPSDATLLPDQLLPPELIVQDEMHLIAGPLGTMVGLYETVIEALCLRTVQERSIRPKILASTATVKHAETQIQALFGRPHHQTALFPPPGVDASETWFATTDDQNPPRTYIGVAAPGRSAKEVVIRTYAALLAAANKVYDPRGVPEQVADGFMTLAGYFNSLRELGGTRRLVEDEVGSRVARAEERRPWTLPGVDPGPHRWFQNRNLRAELAELTSRETTGNIKNTKARLNKRYADKNHVDVLLASNMISVGVDIDRLGLMVVAGQPKTTSEYIQATSRVGRSDWPGLVVTCLNVYKPRDRSHYERFTAYHSSFYRHVEATSLTPFSGPALDRGLAGALVALTRLVDLELTRPGDVMRFEEYRHLGEAAAQALAARTASQPGDGVLREAEAKSVLNRARNLLDAWVNLIHAAREGGGGRDYSPYDRMGRSGTGSVLLHTPLEKANFKVGDDESKFTAPTSMRDVEPTVDFWMTLGHLGGRDRS